MGRIEIEQNQMQIRNKTKVNFFLSVKDCSENFMHIYY